MSASTPDFGEFDQEDIPTGVTKLLALVPEPVRPYAEQLALQHLAMVKLFKSLDALLRTIRILLWLMPVISVVGAVIVWAFLHLEVKR